MRGVTLGIILLGCCIASEAFTRTVTEDEVVRAATAALAEPLFKKTFPDAQVRSVEALEGVWVVHLSPGGHFLFSGSTRQLPMLAYSTDPFSVFPANHPATAMLHSAQAQVRAAEADSGQGEIALFARMPSAAEAQWEALLHRPALTLYSTSEEKKVGPLMTSLWGQKTPFNDFCPQVSAEAGVPSANDRAPVGCVATMYMQIMRYHAWPKWLDTTVTASLPAFECALQSSYKYRLRGGTDLQWSEMTDTYSGLSTSERSRLPVARLGLLSAMLAHMNFAPTMSGAVTPMVCNNHWYEYDEADIIVKESYAPFSEEDVAKIKATLDSGLPIPTSIPMHAVVADGYSVDSNGNHYLHLNYGYSGSNNTFYAFGESGTANNIDWMLLNHAPKLQIQAKPLPQCISPGYRLTWAVPAHHAAAFTGFTINVSPVDNTTMTSWSFNPADTAAYTGDPAIFSGAEATYEAETVEVLAAFKCERYTENFCTFTETFIPSEASVFSCISKSEYTDGFTMEVQIRNAATSDWETLVLLPPSADTDASNWEKTTLSLADYAGMPSQLRLRYCRTTNSIYNWSPYYRIGKLEVSHTYRSTATVVKSWEVAADVREQAIDGLEDGCQYNLSIVPKMVAGKTCRPWSAATTFLQQSIPPPAITSIRSLGADALVEETLFPCALSGTAGLRVTCNDAVVSLSAQTSTPTLVPDSAITVYRYDSTTFDVVLTSAQTIVNMDGSRLILTLVAKDQYGNEVCKDLVLVLRQTTPSTPYDVPELIWTLESGETFAIPHAWFRETGLGTEAAAFSALAAEDADKDGFAGWQEFLCGTDPLNGADKLRITGLEFDNLGGLVRVHFTPQTAENAAFLLEGKATLDEAAWDAADLKVHRFFRLRAILK